MIPVCRPWLPGKELEYAQNAISTGWISSSGDYIERFEKDFAEFCGSKYAVACSSGLAALHLACVALGLKSGDEVIVPTFTMIASANAVIFTGAKPVFVDADANTYCIDVNKIEEKITSRTKAIMPVHIYGHPCKMEKIKTIAEKYSLRVIEDAAEAHGAEYHGKKAGSLSDIGCFSFYANKILTTGEGGMCITNDEILASRMRKLRNHSFDAKRFTHSEVGFNYRLTNVQAAIGCAQVENATHLVESRRKIGLAYNSILSGNKYLELPKEESYAKNVYWMYGVVLSNEAKITKEDAMSKLADAGVETRSFFIPMHKQPVYLEGKLPNSPDCSGKFPVAERLSERGFYLPSSSNLSSEEINFVCDNLKRILL